MIARSSSPTRSCPGLVSIVSVTMAMEEGRLATTGPFGVATWQREGIDWNTRNMGMQWNADVSWGKKARWDKVYDKHLSFKPPPDLSFFPPIGCCRKRCCREVGRWRRVGPHEAKLEGFNWLGSL